MAGRILILVLLITGLSANTRSMSASPGAGLRIVDASDVTKTTPVVNEGGRLQLKVVDGSGNPVAVSAWSTDNKSVGKVNRKKGLLKGKAFGFATITAHTGQGDVSGFIVVARVRRQTGAMTQGDTKTDTGGNVYLSSPTRHVLYKASGLSAEVFAGHIDQSGYQDGAGDSIRFNGPAGIGVDNRAEGGLYIADTMNSVIRKVDFRERSSLAAGVPGFAGTMHGDENPIAEAVFDNPRGVASVGSNLYVTDTNNHCVWYVDVQRQVVELVAGEPGEAGNENGQGRTARFDHPSGITINTRGNLLAVADTGNNIVRLIAIAPRQGGGVIGNVTTLGLGSSSRNADILAKLDTDRGSDQITFDAPISVSFDGVDNVYVIDNQTASVVTRPSAASGRPVERVDLAQVGTLGDPASVTVRRTQAFVLNETPTSESDALSVVEVGAPTISSVTPDTARLEGGEQVTITGTNFAPESKLTLGDAEVSDYTVKRSTRITFTVPAQQAPGGRTLTVLTRGGLAQAKYTIVSKPLAELQDGDITTVYGGIPYLGDGGQAFTANLESPFAVAIDGGGNVYVSSIGAYRVRRIDSATRIITTVAGTGARGFSGDGGPATAATIGMVGSIAVDAAGNLYLVDGDNNRIRRVDSSTGVISTVAGSDERAFDGDGGPVGQAKLSAPSAVAFDSGGNLYIADSARIRRVDSGTSIIATIAETSSYISGLAFNPRGDLFVSDGVDVIRIDSVTGTVDAVAGTGTSGYTGDGGPATSAALGQPIGMACASNGDVYIADYTNHVVRRVIAATGIIETFAGTGLAGTGADGVPAHESALIDPSGVVVDGFGSLVVSDDASYLLRSVDSSTGLISTLSGRFDLASGNGDGGPVEQATIYVGDVAFDDAGNMFVSDPIANRIRRVDRSTHTITTYAGTGVAGFSPDGTRADQAELRGPNALAVAANGDLYFADRGNGRVRRIGASDHRITTVAGNGERDYGGDGGPALQASFKTVLDIAVDVGGNLFISDYTDGRIRRVDGSTGIINTYAGNGTRGFSGDGTPALTAAFKFPYGIDVDGADNVFIADHLNSRVRRVAAATGIIETIAGGGPPLGLGDGGPATSATLIYPTGIAVDSAGNIFVFEGSASGFRKRVRRVDALTGTISTIAGSDVLGYAGDGGPAARATLGFAEDLTMDRLGNLYIVDAYSIRVIKGAAIPR